MSTLSIQPTYPIFTDTDGQPLENGYVWIGVENLEPQTNPLQVYWDKNLTILAPQPIRTISGYPSNNGTPGRLYVNSNYSIRVMNKNGSMVYGSPSATERYSDAVITALDASQVTYQPGGAGAVSINVQTKLREFVNVDDYIPVGTNTEITDCSAFIQAADTYAGANGKSLYFNGVTYLIRSAITISAPWIGVEGRTAIKIPSDFVYPTTSFDPRRYSAITNLNCSSVFNSSTADNVYISGIKFLDGGGVNGKDTIGLANVKGGNISDCIFTTETNEIRTPVDLFACVKNFSIERTKIYNLTQNAVGGGGMWIRNITGNGAISTNSTENINVVDCYFEHTSLDEALAVYGVLGLTKNVRVTRCTFNGTVLSSSRHGTLVSAFPLGANIYAAVQDIVFSECRFESNNFINTIFRAGQTADASRVCKDIRVENCYFSASLPVPGLASIARSIRNVGGNIIFSNNIIDATNTPNNIEFAVNGFDSAFNTTVYGKVNNAFYICRFVDACVVKDTSGAGSFNCQRVSNSTITTSGNGIVCNDTAYYEVINNQITLTATSGLAYGIIYNSVAGSAPSGVIDGNVVTINNPNAFVLGVRGANANIVRIINNTFNGTGRTIFGGVPVKEIQGNDWFGTLDSMRSAGYIDANLNSSTPIGTYATAITHTAGSNSYLLGFIKTESNNVSADWKNVYAGNSLT